MSEVAIPSNSQVENDNVDNLKGKFSLMWKFSTRGFVMMIILAFAFSHLMTRTIERSLLQMSSEGFDRHYSRIKTAIDTYYGQKVKVSLKEHLSYWFKQTDLAALRVSDPSIDLILCKPDIIEKALRKYEKSQKRRKINGEINQFSLHVEKQFILPMLAKRFIIETNNKGAVVVQLYIHYTWVQWKLIEFRVISVIASLVLMIFLLLAAGGPVKDASKKLLVYSKKLEEAVNNLESANVELEQKSRHLIQTSKLAALGELSAAVAHEIKNPLAAISSGLQLVELQLEQEGKQDSKAGEIIKRVSSEVERLSKILVSMLRFARPSNQQDISFIIAPLIEKVALLVHKHASDQNVRISCKTEGCCNREDCSRKVLGDPIQIEQVLLNLILNSIEAMESGGNIEIALTCSETEVVIKVIDSGTGIGDRNEESLFMAFSNTTKDNGTGLGLSISRSIIQKHGGSLTLSNNQIVHGATATIILPRHLSHRGEQ